MTLLLLLVTLFLNIESLVTLLMVEIGWQVSGGISEERDFQYLNTSANEAFDITRLLFISPTLIWWGIFQLNFKETIQHIQKIIHHP